MMERGDDSLEILAVLAVGVALTLAVGALLSIG